MNPKPMETLLGGNELTADRLDGQSEVVFVRQLPIRSFNKLLALMDDEPATVELYCDKQKGWSDEITVKSFEAIIAEGERINSDFFSRWLRRKMDRQEKIMPGLMDRMLAGTSTLPSTSPPSPSSPD